MMDTCRKCKKPISPDFTFCPYCGCALPGFVFSVSDNNSVSDINSGVFNSPKKDDFATAEKYYYGSGVVYDETAALAYYLNASLQGEVKAQYAIGAIYYYRDDIGEDDEDFSDDVQALLNSYAEEWYVLDELFFAKDSKDKDLVWAFNWFLKAAERGHKKAQYKVAEMYYYGKGTDRNQEEAFKWYMKAAEQGNDDAQYKVEKFLEKKISKIRSNNNI